MDASQLSLSTPYLIDNGFVPKHYLQYLKYQNGPIRFQSPLFFSQTGPKVGLSKNYQLCVSLGGELRQQLKTIENFVANNLKLPSPLAETWKQYCGRSGETSPFKPLFESSNLFMKLANQISVYIGNFGKN